MKNLTESGEVDTSLFTERERWIWDMATNAAKSPESSVWPGEGVQMIAKERQRQIEIEKWDYNHDADYKHGELIGAAACYAMEAANKDLTKPIFRAQIHQDAELDFMVNSRDRGDRSLRPAGWKDAWPWDQKWDKRWKHDKLRCLQIAGALIAAEIDRLNPSTLQSRTAVKAEDWDLIKNFAKYFWCYETGADWQGTDKQFNMIADHFCADRDNPIQSQPTAGGVKEEGFNPEKQAGIISLAQSMFQPSPSNPSIKRPTEKEINTGRYIWIYDHYGHSQAETWDAAINWLLSIQDKI